MSQLNLFSTHPVPVSTSFSPASPLYPEITVPQSDSRGTARVNCSWQRATTTLLRKPRSLHQNHKPYNTPPTLSHHLRSPLRFPATTGWPVRAYLAPHASRHHETTTGKPHTLHNHLSTVSNPPRHTTLPPKSPLHRTPHTPPVSFFSPTPLLRLGSRARQPITSLRFCGRTSAQVT